MIRDLEACLESYTGVREVIFLGDLFDAYLEYPRSIQAVADMVAPLFRTLIERCVDVHYHIGNHGLWLAFMVLMVVRAITLGARYPAIVRDLEDTEP